MLSHRRAGSYQMSELKAFYWHWRRVINWSVFCALALPGSEREPE